MQSYTLTDTRDRNSEVFEKAANEPVLVTKQSRPLPSAFCLASTTNINADLLSARQQLLVDVALTPA